MQIKEKTKSFLNIYGWQSFALLVLLLLARLMAMYWIPLNDSTEARYAEIARLMVVSHNWVSLMHYPGEYFWAKPPFSTWTSATSMSIFGISPFSARLPGWFLSIGCLVLVSKMASQQFGARGAYLAISFLVTTFYFIYNVGTVMTEPSLVLFVSLVMLSFWMAMNNGQVIWRWLVFAGWGLGLLTKGLVMGVFTVLPLITWLAMTKQFKKAWFIFPWIKGSLLTLLIAAPWFIMAENRTPGFLNYFFIGEHFMRFLKPGWTGDKYGFAHEAPLGMIWLYFVMGTMPWLVHVILWTKNKRKEWNLSTTEKQWFSYLLCFIFMPILFFTFSRNIIYPYVFPVIPAFSLLVMTIFLKSKNDKDFTFIFNTAAIIYTLVIVAIIFAFEKFPMHISKSNDQMIYSWKKQRHSLEEKLIYLLPLPEYSSMFYSDGQVKAILDKKTLCYYLKAGPQFVVTSSDWPTSYESFFRKKYAIKYILKHRNRIDRLYYIDSLPYFCK